jgi:hypothetical protein
MRAKALFLSALLRDYAEMLHGVRPQYSIPLMVISTYLSLIACTKQ